MSGFHFQWGQKTSFPCFQNALDGWVGARVGYLSHHVKLKEREGTLLNVSITGVLFYGVKWKDTTHIFIWQVFSVIESIFSIILMCYYAIQSDNILKIQGSGIL